MKTGLLLLTASLLLSAAATPNRKSDTLETPAGPVKITPLYHGSVMLEFAGKVVHVDPWSRADYTGLPQADLILITHTHADHMDVAAIKPLKKDSTILIGPPAVTDTLNGAVGDTDAISNGEKKTVFGIEIEAVPMYNIKLGSAPGKPYHHKGIGNGYILSFGGTNGGGTRVYFSGDTECTPEMKALKNITVAFLAINPPRTMPPAEAAACVEAFRPKIVYPYHYRGQKTQDFADALKNTPGVEVRLRSLEGESR